jgi:hypothetical protein
MIFMVVYSYKMLMEPASKVSVPPVVVTRSLSKTPPRVIFPVFILPAPVSVRLIIPLATHPFPEILVITRCPVNNAAAAPKVDLVHKNPSVVDVPIDVVLVPSMHMTEAAYPDVGKEPEPICTVKALGPFVLTP